MIYTNHQRKVFTCVLISLLFLVNVASGHALPSAPIAPASKTISIAEARSLSLGTVVTIEGTITVPSGAFSSSTFDQGFQIQDRTAGIYVSTADNLGFALGQRVRVTGTLADTVLPGLLVLVDATVDKSVPGGQKVTPLPVATGAVGEATEGTLVQLTATISQPIVNDLPFGFIIFVNDGSGEVHVFVCASTGIDVSGLSQGQTIQVTGISGQFADSFEVDPRVQSDIKVN
jgi:hypothetical protein